MRLACDDRIARDAQDVEATLMDVTVSLIMASLLIIGFLIGRWFVTWYFKIDEIVSLLKKIVEQGDK